VLEVANAHAHRDAISEFVATRRVQFTEPLRSSLLLPGLLTTARETGRPLRLVEIGAAAGLLLAFDRYRHVFSTGTWGPADSPLRMTSPLPVPPDLLDTRLEVADRVGIDLALVSGPRREPTPARGQRAEDRPQRA
jgi:hypothetical protein